ncbi:Protein LEG1, partial [Clarias magur]
MVTHVRNRNQVKWTNRTSRLYRTVCTHDGGVGQTKHLHWRPSERRGSFRQNRCRHATARSELPQSSSVTPAKLFQFRAGLPPDVALDPDAAPPPTEASERSLLISHESELLSLSSSLVELLPKEEASSSLMSCLVSSQ